MSDGCAVVRAAAPRLCADCNLRRARCVRGDGGALISVARCGARVGMESRVGLGMLQLGVEAGGGLWGVSLVISRHVVVGHTLNLPCLFRSVCVCVCVCV